MKTPKPILFLCLLVGQLTSFSQVQWYQNQDGNNQIPNGTVGTSINPFVNNSFIACYQWKIQNDNYTWKISKTNVNGTEQRCFFVTGPTTTAEVRIGRYNTVYVLQRSFPQGQNPEYRIYKLDANLNIQTQRTISFPNSFNIFNLNAFELDNSDNVYVAGDGQYPVGPGFSPASFVLKADKNLNTKWSRMDSVQTSYARLHITHNGYVQVVSDFYTSFPDVKIIRFSQNGQLVNTKTIQTDPGRYSLYSMLDDEDNLILYGGKSVNDTTQALYLYKIAYSNGRVVYRKTLFTAPGSQLNDLKMDKQGNIFTVVALYAGSENQVYKVSRINTSNGNISWNISFNYGADSCMLSRLVVDDKDKFYVVGEKRGCTYFSRGFAMRIKKNGHTDEILGGPDSINYQRTHYLVDGITDNNNQLIALGNTNDFDTLTGVTTYYRSFAVRYGAQHGGGCDAPLGKGEAEGESEAEETKTEVTVFNEKTVVYPNPVQDELTVSNQSVEEYDRLAIYNMQGTLQQQQSFSGAKARMDVSGLKDGVYLLILRSSATGKEKNVKFIVKR